jgi:hypothetical protein
VFDDYEEDIDGDGILKYAANFVGCRGPVVFFPPKETPMANGIELTRNDLTAGCMEGLVVMEQNVLNGKLNTYTAYVAL